MVAPPTKVVVVGAEGLLGRSTMSVFGREPGASLLGVDLPELDITDARQVQDCLGRFQPDLVINCAAYTQVDACEEYEDLACRVNGDGAGHVAQAAAMLGARMYHISTDYVFDGRATSPYPVDHPTAPPQVLSAYGRSKLLGEQRVRSAHPDALIIRTAWLYGPYGPGFPDAILRRARETGALRVVNDQTGSPTYAPDLAEALFKLSRTALTGFVHVSNDGQCTWYEFALEIVRMAGLHVPVEPVTTAEFPRPARRPAYSVLDNSRYVETVGKPLRHWREAIAEYVARYGGM